MTDSTLVAPGSDWWELKLVKQLAKSSPKYFATLQRVYTCVEPLAKARPRGSEEFTDHDLAHSTRLVRRIGQIMPDSVKLNAAELYILLSAALLHDLGMWMSKEEADTLFSTDTAFLAWCRKHESAALALVEKMLAGNQRHWMGELGLQRLAATYARIHHPTRLATTLVPEHGNTQQQQLRTLLDEAFVNQIILVSEAHGWERQRVLDDPHLRPEEIGDETVNLRYLAFLLRLGDLLDMGKGRVSSLMWTYLYPLNTTSEAHWRKEMTLEVPLCSSKSIRVRGTFDIDRYGIAAAEAYTLAHEWLQYLQDEIDLGVRKLQLAIEYTEMPELKDAYCFDVLKLDTSAVTANGLVLGGKVSLEMDRDRILTLLGSEIYTDGFVFVRELLQNAIDATRAQMIRDYRTETNDHSPGVRPWELPSERTGQERYAIDVTVETASIDGIKFDVYTMQDRGIGMTTKQIRDYFLQVGKSYYQSKYNDEFTHPSISRFGIGFLSCLLAAEKIEVTTRPHTESTGLLLTLNRELSEYTVIKSDNAAPGTTVRLWLNPNYASQQQLPFGDGKINIFRGEQRPEWLEWNDNSLYITTTKQWGLWPEMLVQINGETWGPRSVRTTQLMQLPRITTGLTQRRFPFRFYSETGELLATGKLLVPVISKSGLPMIRLQDYASTHEVDTCISVRSIWISNQRYGSSSLAELDFYKTPLNTLSAGRSLRGNALTNVSIDKCMRICAALMNYTYHHLRETAIRVCALWRLFVGGSEASGWPKEHPSLLPYRTRSEYGWAPKSDLIARFDRFLFVPMRLAMDGPWNMELPCVGCISPSVTSEYSYYSDYINYPLVVVDGVCTALLYIREADNLEYTQEGRGLEGLTLFRGKATKLFDRVYLWEKEGNLRTTGDATELDDHNQLWLVEAELPEYDRGGNPWKTMDIAPEKIWSEYSNLYPDIREELADLPPIQYPEDLYIVLEDTEDWT